MATDTNIKNALTFPERSDNLIYSQGKTIDAAAWLWHWASTTIKQSEKAAAELAAVVEPAEFGT
jgi:hypothetical protein